METATFWFLAQYQTIAPPPASTNENFSLIYGPDKTTTIPYDSSAMPDVPNRTSY
jgi:hypothetical protein